ncbi:hypothetical protein GCM10023235_66580 [Kitasatospora terrestris]|uniref:Uncharacterized protein n=1 Tax=Kitasatospora terrestris TaxID=258051 RepID=A0ABP9EF58_9ACTN
MVFPIPGGPNSTARRVPSTSSGTTGSTAPAVPSSTLTHVAESGIGPWCALGTVPVQVKGLP